LSEKIQIDAASLLQTIDRLEKYIESLKEIIGQLSERLMEVRAAIDGIKRV
jgi:prefoldin subunit 5